MKNTKHCPKCKSNDIVKVKETSQKYIHSHKSMGGCKYFCCNCGFQEVWIVDSKSIAKQRKWYLENKTGAMKNCPKCNSNDIINSGKLQTKTGTNIPVGITIWNYIPIEKNICCSCGFLEAWVENLHDAAKVKDHYRNQGVETTKPCPKCQSDDIIIVIRKTPDGINIKTGIAALNCAPVAKHLCCNCGFVEEWVDDSQDIVKVKDYYQKHRK